MKGFRGKGGRRNKKISSRKWLVLQATLAAALVAVLVAAPAATAGLNTGGGAWSWVHPSVQGNPVRSLSFVDANTGWAAGGAGLIMKTTDGGNNWTVQSPSYSCSGTAGAGCNLNGVSFVDSNNGWAVGTYGTIWRTSNGGSSWSTQSLPSGNSGTELYGVSFASTSVGVAIGYGSGSSRAFKTSNGGSSWTTASGISGSDYLNAVQMVDASTGYIVGTGGAIYKTTDGGGTWTSKDPGTTTALYGVYFIDANNGFAVGGSSNGSVSNGYILRTTDGGDTWSVNSATTINVVLNKVAVTDGGNTLVAVGEDGTVFRRNAATNWTDGIETVASGLGAVSSGTTSYLTALNFAPGSSTGYFGGDGGVVGRTADSGTTWAIKAGGDDVSLYGSSFIDANTGWAVGADGTVRKTTDGGATWSNDNSGIPSDVTLHSVQFLSATAGFAVGCQSTGCRIDGTDGNPTNPQPYGTGVAYKYNSGTWTALSVSGGPASINSIRMTSGTSGLAVGSGGSALRTTDGSTWSPVSTGINSGVTLNSVDTTDASANGWAAGELPISTGPPPHTKGVVLKFNGSSWSQWDTGNASGLVWLDSIDMVSAATGYVAGSGGRIYKTTNGGSTWTQLTTGSTMIMAGVAFFNEDIGFAAGQNGRILKTVNGGTTWTIEAGGTNLLIYGVTVATGPVMTAYVYGSSAAILKFNAQSLDSTAPTVGSVSPSGWTGSSTTITAPLSDNSGGLGVSPTTVSVSVDGGPPLTGCTNTQAQASCPVTGLSDGNHTVAVSVADYAGNTGNGNGSFNVDTVIPTLSLTQPGATVSSGEATIAATYSDTLSGVNTGSVSVSIDGSPVSGSDCTVQAGSVSCTASGFGRGTHPVAVTVADNGGNSTTQNSSFTVSQLSYYWTWYDMTGSSKNWVLMANRQNSGQTAWFDLLIGGSEKTLTPLDAGNTSKDDPGEVPQGTTAFYTFNGTQNGPVDVGSLTGDKAITSQRVLWGDSLEEVPGTEESRLSDHFYWSWYDQQSPGMSNWVMVANPTNDVVKAEVSFTVYTNGAPSGTETKTEIMQPASDPANSRKYVQFAGKMGGPVEVKAYVNGGTWSNDADHRDIIASQRVLSNNGTAFNEVPGIPAGGGESELASEYYWTWYDMTGGAKNWVLVANPLGSSQVDVTVSFTDINTNQVVTANKANLQAGEMWYPTFSGKIGGPVKVSATGNVIASQRSLWGPSFEEVPGTPTNLLNNDYHWTWYDNTLSDGFKNWVLVANPSSTTSVNYQIWIAGTCVEGCSPTKTLNANERATPMFSNKGGPVEVVSTGGNVIASQRVLYKGYFNETLGITLD